ncbi:S-layer protein domain-containing protein [Methanolobus sediminis]|uniref:S-layer protein domain-containing protein n=1 Tax=Methanolobus sediminis TaxID=3072978 RepID=A0AA51YKT0_9EURY|nr:S-layer protein domain-containing protein [Methanolobus sediminis]WMW24222.1 S-layer protein domain-containing protein [Methanolobus sediminis]
MRNKLKLILFGLSLIIFTGLALGSAPTLSNVGSSSISLDSAVISYDVNQSDADTQIEYGTTPSLGSSSAIYSGLSSYSETLSGLSSGTTYYYSVFAYNSSNPGEFSNSTIDSFTTTAASTDSAPALSNVGSSSISSDSAVISYDVNQSDADTQIEYGTTPSLGSSSAIYSGLSSYSQTLSSLSSGTTYYYSVFAYNSSDSSLFSNSTIDSFTTTAASTDSAPVLSNVGSSSISSDSAVISYDVNQSDADTQIEYGTTPSLGSSSAIFSGLSSYSETLSGLSSGTTYYYSVFAYNSSDSSLFSNSTIDSFTTSASSSAPDASFTTNVTDDEGEVPLTVQFNDTSDNDPTSWEWDFDDGSANSTVQNPVHTFDSVGTYDVTLTATNADGSDSTTTTITVYSQTYYTGDRIWDENANQSADKYIWDAKSFSGFFYDLESGFSSESMTIYNIDRSLGDGDIVYQTSPVETDFENSDWGSYQVIGFMAEKYFAGYTDDTDIDGVDEVSLMSAGQLSKVLLDDDDKESVYSGSSLILEEGYELNVVEVDVNGDSVYVTLTQDGDELDSAVISSGDDYVYETDLGDADDVALIIVHIDDVFSGTESNAVFIQGVFQISDDYVELEDGESYGEMEITSISDDLIEMENDGTVSLSKGKTINLMGSINLIVADNDDLRFAPYVDMSDPGTYELRGTVAEEDELLTWTPLNFEGFYYDIDEGIQTEKLELTAISGRTIDDGDLVYTSVPKPVEFEHSDWGEFQVIGFMAEKYFAGYTDDTDVDGVDDVSLMSNGQLSEVLLDDDDKASVYSGSSLILEEGYTLDIIEVDTSGDSVLIELYQDGDEVDTEIVSANDDYVYEKDLGDADDVPIIIIHFNEVFAGSESNAVFVEGIFQISEDYISLEDGDTYGEMEVTSYSEDSIVMKNEDSISLSKDKDITLMGEVGIRVADSGTLRYYPYVEVTTAASQALTISLSDSTVSEGDEVTITVTSRGSRIADATVKVEGTTIGTTDDEGTIDYDADEIGTLEITAEKDGYTSASEDLEVIDPDDETRKMSIEVSPDKVYVGNSITIYVLQAIGGDEISGVTVTFDGKSIGTTDSDGTVTYTATEAGTHSIEATKSGMNDAELDLKVNELAAEFEFSNLEISPLEIKQGQKATITADVTNTGTAEGSYNVELKVDDVIVDSQTITLSVGNSTTVEFTHEEEEPGTYEVQLGDLTTTYEVFEKSGTIWYVLGAIGLAAIGGVAYLFTAGGWTVEIAQAKAAEAVAAIKELIGK